MPRLKIKVPCERKDNMLGSFTRNITSNITLSGQFGFVNHCY